MTQRRNSQTEEQIPGISRISISGYKSIDKEQSIEVRPLTVLAGPNSSGKSSIMQPLLLLKQTLEAPYDPGALWLGGPNVEFTSVEQLLSRGAKGFQVKIDVPPDNSIKLYFGYAKDKGLQIQEISYPSRKQEISIRADMTHDEIMEHVPNAKTLFEMLSRVAETELKPDTKLEWAIIRDRCFLQAQLRYEDDLKANRSNRSFSTYLEYTVLGLDPDLFATRYLRDVIHVPGLRGNPERSYPVTAVGSSFPGQFQSYVASVIARWQAENNDLMLNRLVSDLRRLDLTSSVAANRINDTQVELQVGRLSIEAKRNDMVNIADVGFGVSQALPVLVALNVAQPGQLVYIEQPEIHLHPKAQWEMAYVLAAAANRGVRVVVETHSSLLVLGIQTLVAEGQILRDAVKLHWFTRNKSGSTQVTSADLSASGAFGNWPQNFADVTLEAQIQYLNAAEAHPVGTAG